MIRSRDINQFLGIAAVLSIMVGLFFSPAMMSIGMMALVFNALIGPNPANVWSRFWSNRALVVMTLIFWICLLSGLYSQNGDYFLNRLIMKLPFLVMPFAVTGIPDLGRKVLNTLLIVFFSLVVGVALFSFFEYLNDYQKITQSYLEGKVLPLPVPHIYFSMMAVLSLAIGFHLVKRGAFRSRAPFLISLGVIFLFIYIHLLAVRTGLVLLYGWMMIYGLWRILQGRKYKLAFLFIVFVVLIAMLASSIPTVRNKTDYTKYTWERFSRGESLAGYSDGYRIASIHAGFWIASRYMLTGVGYGDLKDETVRFINSEYPELSDQIYIPQLQYLVFLAATGAVGLAICLFALLYPLFYRKSYRQGLVLSFHIILLLSFATEQILESQIGTGIYIVFASLLTRNPDHEKTERYSDHI